MYIFYHYILQYAGDIYCKILNNFIFKKYASLQARIILIIIGLI